MVKVTENKEEIPPTHALSNLGRSYACDFWQTTNRKVILFISGFGPASPTL